MRSELRKTEKKEPGAAERLHPNLPAIIFDRENERSREAGAVREKRRHEEELGSPPVETAKKAVHNIYGQSR